MVCWLSGWPCCSRGLDENKARWFFQQLILALDYCHKMNISNRDIKLENTLLHSQGHDRRPMVKLCDFGAFPAAVSWPIWTRRSGLHQLDWTGF